MRHYEQTIRPLANGAEADALKAMRDSYPRMWVLAAIKEAGRSGGKSIRYVESILTRWEREGFKAGEGDEAHGRSGCNGQRAFRRFGETLAEKGERRKAEEAAKWARDSSGWG